jgi:hypothetical protein
MEFSIQVVGWVVGLTLEALILSALLRGHYKRFPFVFAYTLANFLIAIIEIRLTLNVRAHRPGSGSEYWFQWWYWRNEAVLQLLLFSVVISLIYYSIDRTRSRRIVLLGLAAGAVLFSAITFAIHFKPNAVSLGVWMTPWSRDLYVASTLLDLALWARLIAAKQKDHRLLMLSGALGIQLTGEAIGESVRYLADSLFPKSHAGQIPGNILIMLANLTAMYIWWQTFRRPPNQTDPPQKPEYKNI